jgi:prepilin-type N-terminal cleavage/methylation domain-containing protein
MRIDGAQKGFTLIEAMVATIILSIGLLGVGTMLTTSMATDRKSQEKRNAEGVALKRMEELTAKAADLGISQMKLLEDTGYNHEVDSGRSIDVPNPGRHYVKSENGYMMTRYRYRFEILSNSDVNMSDPDESFPNGFLQINVFVGWGGCGRHLREPTSCTDPGKCPNTCRHELRMTNFVHPNSTL